MRSLAQNYQPDRQSEEKGEGKKAASNGNKLIDRESIKVMLASVYEVEAIILANTIYDI